MNTTHGFARVAAATPLVRVADTAFNAAQAIALLTRADRAGVHVVVFPELNLTGYTVNDLFHQQALQAGALDALDSVCRATKELAVLGIVGLPLAADNQLFNCAAVVQRGRVLGIVPKTFIPGYKEYYEERWFARATDKVSDEVACGAGHVPFGADLLFRAADMPGLVVGVEICEDLWVPIPPSSYQAVGGATVLANLSASNELVAKPEYRAAFVRQQSGRCAAAYVLAAAGVGESTTDMVFSGHTMIAENGVMIADGTRFARTPQLAVADIDIDRLVADRQRTTSFGESVGAMKPRFRAIPFTSAQPAWKPPLERPAVPHPFVPQDPDLRDERCAEIFAIQTAALAKRLEHTRTSTAVIGLSGGLDSTLALLVCVKTFELLGLDKKGIHGLTMPGFGTSRRTYANVQKLCAALGLPLESISIVAACRQHFRDIGQDPGDHDNVYENTQSRERMQILMNRANQLGGLVVGTGDMSELALGWCTYNGDHMSMYNVNCGVPKTLVRYLVHWVAERQVEGAARRVLLDIVSTPISPELLPTGEDGEIRQKTEHEIGPYDLHDFFLYHVVRFGARPAKIVFLAGQAFKGAYTKKEIKKWLRVFYTRFFVQQFKRSCVPDGPKVGSVSLSPRGDWRMPSDAEAATWLAELDKA